MPGCMGIPGFSGLRHRPEPETLMVTGNHLILRAPMTEIEEHYNIENGAILIEMRLRKVMQIFNSLDPSPFHEKDLDPDAEAYIAEHGNSSWEVDALPPQVLRRVITTALDQLVDHELMDEVKAQEERDKELLTAAVQALRKKSKKK
jgi:hypothetical protein